MSVELYKIFNNRSGNPVRMLIKQRDPVDDSETLLSWDNLTRVVLNLHQINEDKSATLAPLASVNSVDDTAAFDTDTDGYLTMDLSDLKDSSNEELIGSFYARISAVFSDAGTVEISHEQHDQTTVFNFIKTSEL